MCGGRGGPLQLNHHIFSSRKGYNLPKATKTGQQYRIRCQLHLGSQYSFYNVSPSGHFVVHFDLFQNSKLIQKHLFGLKKRGGGVDSIFIQLYVQICCLRLQIVKPSNVLRFWELIYCVCVAGGEDCIHQVTAVIPLLLPQQWTVDGPSWPGCADKA